MANREQTYFNICQHLYNLGGEVRRRKERRNGKFNGQGTFTWSDEGKYEGKWKDGKFHGQGTFTFSDGNKGVGEFRYNKPWNITTFDKYGNYKWKYVKGVRVK